MIKILLLLTALIFSACVNKRGVSLNYYDDCKEYYDLQGFYHKKCREDGIVTYKEMGEKTDKIMNYFSEEKKIKQQSNVW